MRIQLVDSPDNMSIHLPVLGGWPRKRASAIRQFVTFAFLSMILWAATEHVNVAQAGNVHRSARQGDVKVELRDDVAQGVLTIRIGPMNLPAHMPHRYLPDLFMPVPFDAWFIAYHSGLLDEQEQFLPRNLLHHLVLFNSTARDMICEENKEVLFAAGSELTIYPEVPGMGYRVKEGNRIKIQTMVANPTNTAYPRAFLEVQVKYKRSSELPPLKDVYPALFYIGQCRGNPLYDLKPGRNMQLSVVEVRYAGKLITAGGHMHDYALELKLENVTKREEILTLKPQLDAEGRLLSMPQVSFTDSGGYKLDRGDIVKLTAIYDNPTGKRLRMAGMAVIIGAFLPDNGEELAAAKRIK